MVTIVETDKEFQTFIDSYKSFDWVAIPVFCNGDVHHDRLSLLFVYVLHEDIYYIIVFNHSEGLPLPELLLEQLPDSNKIFILDKKKFISNPNVKISDNLIDINLVEWFNKNVPITDEFDTPAHEFYLNRFGRFYDLNTIIPISKHIEKCMNICNRFLEAYQNFEYTDSFKYYNNVFVSNFAKLESPGLCIDADKFKTHFTKDIHIIDSKVYTDYNMYTTTGRPSNTNSGINFAALTKTGQRESFISRWGKDGLLVGFDYDAYHLRLLAELMEYTLPATPAHEYLGKYYFGKSELTEAEYEESKAISFRQLYGGVGKEYLEIPFFAKVQEYTETLWQNYETDGYIETPLFGRRLYNHFFVKMTPPKLLNYLLQSFETERNMAVISNIYSRITSFSSCLILYTYDSCLWDFYIKDGKDFINLIVEEMTADGRYPVDIEVGKDYHNMIYKKL